MENIFLEFAKLLLFILPSWLANSSPVLLGGKWPVDFGAKFFDKRRIFGNGKTWLGIAAGLSVGFLAATLEAHLLPNTQFDFWGGSAYNYLLGGFLLASGALFGDLFGSFIKRRASIPRGNPSFVLDQLSFLAFSLIAIVPIAPQILTPLNIGVLFILTFFVHRLANWWAHTAGLKKVPW